VTCDPPSSGSADFGGQARGEREEPEVEEVEEIEEVKEEADESAGWRRVLDVRARA